MNKDLGAAAIILTAVLLMTIADAMIKAFMGDLGLWQLFLTRAPFALALLVGLAAVLPGKGWGLASAWAALRDPWVTLRSVLVVLMYLFMYMSFPYLKLAVMGAAFFIAPIFTALMAALFLKDRIGLRGWLGVALGFVGVMVVSRPGTSVFQPAIFLPVIAGLCYSFAAVLTRAKLQQSNTLGVALSLNLILMILSGLLVLGLNFAPPPAAWVEHSPFMLRPWAPMAGQDWAAIVVMAVLICGITVLLALAYQVGRTVLVAAHGNSLRAMVKHLDNISDADIAGVNIPTGIPLVYRLDANLRPVVPGGEYLDPDAAATAAAAVAAQGKA